MERGDHEGAITVLRDLLSRDISDVDKAMMCLNIAVVCDKMGRVDEALSWYGKGVDYERPHARHFVAERRAAYLAERGLDRQSLARYEELRTLPALTEDEKERIRRNIEVLRSR